LALKFDPIETRRILDGDLGYETSLAKDLEETIRLRALTWAANAELNRAVQCILVGYDDPARRLLESARRQLTIAIDEDEKTHSMPLSYARAQRHHDMAQCAWLTDNVRDRDNLERFVANDVSYYADMRKPDKIGVSLAAVDYLDAGAYQPLLELLRRARVPLRTDATRTEAEMAYAIASARLSPRPSATALKSDLHGFLSRKVNTWLLDGHHMRAAQWMKVANAEDEATRSPKEIIWMCYDYLKGVARPV